MLAQIIMCDTNIILLLVNQIYVHFIQTIILLFLMILILLYGYFNPYKGRLNNILELSILILFLFLLLLRANSQLDDILQKAPHNTSVSIPSCGTDTDPLTSFASMLAVFYYIPLFIGLVCVCIYIM